MNRYHVIILFLSALVACSSRETKRHAARTAYNEPYRPQFHFSPPQKWMNDPNGMVYYKGEYHLFYQYYPDGMTWGPMHWGHAISKDLVRWENLPIAIYPDSAGMIFSGSAVVDVDNTSKLGTAENRPLVAIYTIHDMKGEKQGRVDFQTQGLAYSLDDGREWKKFKGNPVLKNKGARDFRDPHVFWHKASGQWIMILAVHDHIEIFQSPDPIAWKKSSEFGKNLGAHGGVWECPDLFQLKFDGSERTKWVMLVSVNPGGPNGGSATQYFIGDFDGAKFQSDDQKIRWIDYGKDNYAGVTWNNAPDDRRIFLGWMSNWQYATVVPTSSWRGATTVPRELMLTESENGPLINSMPVNEMTTLRTDTIAFGPEAKPNELISLDTSGVELDFEFSRSQGDESVVIEIANEKGEKIEIGLDGKKNQFYVDRTKASPFISNDFAGVHYAERTSHANTVNLKVLIDRSSVEVFADKGKTVITEIFFPSTPMSSLRLPGNEGVKVEKATLYHLRSIWEKE